MKETITIIFIFMFNININSQSNDWNYYDFDSIVSLEMPGDVFEIDSIFEYRKYYQIYSKNDSINFLVQKVDLEKKYINIENVNLPKSKKELESFYIENAWILDDLTEGKLNDYSLINIDILTGLQLDFINNNKIVTTKIYLFLINNNLYSFYHTNLGGIINSDSNLFFNSITFNDQYELKQYPGKSLFSTRNIMVSLLIILVLSFIIKFKN